MSYRPGGVDSDEIRAGFESLQRVRSADELERLINDMPVLSTPIFHTRLRYELHRQISEHDKPFPDFLQVYDYLFMSLHNRAHRKLVESAGPPVTEPTRSERVESFTPSYYSQMAEILGNQLPRAEGPTLNPSTDAPDIQAEIEAATGRSIALPEYQPSIGSYWSLVLVSCASCYHIWLKTCPYGIDLIQAPEFGALLQGGRLDSSTCPLCAEALCLPLRVWLQEGPGAGDTLASLTCAWRVSDSMFVYQPPPSTPKINQSDRILEIRFAKLLQRLDWDDNRSPSGDSREGSYKVFGIAYSTDEVLKYVRRSKEAEIEIPFAMEAMVFEISRKFESGILPIYDAEHFIKTTVRDQNWPIVNSDDPLTRSSKPFYHLTLCLAAEASAEIQQLPNAMRTIFAARTCAGFFSIKEVALAEAALARAEDFLKNVPTKDPGHSAAALSVADARSLLFSYLGRHVEAEQVREQIIKSPLMSADSLEVRLTRVQLESQAALSLKRQGNLVEALKIYPKCIAALEMMEEEVTSSEEEHGDVLVQIWHSLSGDLANWGAILITLGERLEAVGKMHKLIIGGAEPDEVGRVMKSSHLEPDDLPVTAAAIAVLEEMFAPGITHKTLFELGRLLLDKALKLSEASEEWEFAGIQAYRLAGLLHFHLEESEAAQEHMRKAIDYASRVGAHSQVSTGHFFFAELARQRGDGTEALNCLLASAREEIRHQVGMGYYAQPKGIRLTLSDAALRSVALGGDARVAVMIAESLKVPTTAAAMVRGFPAGPGTPSEHLEGVLLDELLARRELLRIGASRGSQVDADVSKELRQIELEIKEKRKVLSLRDSRFTRWVDATNLDVSDPRALLRRLGRLGPRTTFLGMLPVGRTVWTYAIWDDGCILSEQPLPPIEGQPPPDYVSLSEPQETWEQEYLEKLAAALLDPLEARLSELEPHDRLIISTSDPLVLVPFSGLPYKGRPLCEHVCISQTYGVGILEGCLDRAKNNVNSVLCVGNPSRPDRKEISETHREVVTVAGLFRQSGKQAVSLAWDFATVPNLKAEAEQYDVLHFACHAEFASALGESSRLLLTPDFHMQDSGDLSEDRILSELPIREGCLINLAGCHTGAQSNSKGFLLGGLVPSFLIAGAGSVIGSLWELDDTGAATFQIEFYRLLVNGKSPAESLAETQRACLRGELGPAMRDVSMWAGYALYGVG